MAMMRVEEPMAHLGQGAEAEYDCGCDGLAGVDLEGEEAISLPIDEAGGTVKISRRKAIAYMGGFLLLAACGAPGSTSDSATTPGTASGSATASSGAQGLVKVDLAFCSQTLCILPFEVARQRGYFKEVGLDVNLIYMKGGPPAITALLAKQLDFIGTPIDLVVKATADGKPLVMVTSTSRLPFFALITSPQVASTVQSIKDLKGKKVGVGAVGSTDDLLTRYLLTQNGLTPDDVETIPLGPNLYEQLMSGQVDAGMVQEPSLTLGTQRGSRVLVNFMDLKDTQAKLGGAYQFMGLNTRPDVLQDPAKVERLKNISRSLVRANKWMLAQPGAEIVKYAPAELVSGDKVGVFAAALDKYKADLYPSDGLLNADSVARVIDVQRKAGLIPAGKNVTPEQVFTNQYVQGS
jgi:NitT/TauT family transport system substrate-binding protein